MVHIKRVELAHFKSFGGTTQIPLLPGFTVVSGPNGSGKSNILDALLFCLGLASSKGMRAERLPDLVNNSQPQRGTKEASVTVTFDLEDREDREDTEDMGDRGNGLEDNPKSTIQNLKSTEWSVTRKLRVTKQGSYTSTYYMNGVSCTLTELHEQLNELRIYPEGYNVVLQGDVTSIISMNVRERREIIDELAGVATFDRKISQAKETLDEVKDREDSCRIVERELVGQRDRLSSDRTKAEKYQKLRTEHQEKQQWEAVLVWRSLFSQQEKLATQIQGSDRTSQELTTRLDTLALEINQQTTELEQLNSRVKALGEDELLAVQSTLATQEAERKQLERQQQQLQTATQETEKRLQQTQQEIQQYRESLVKLASQQDLETLHLTSRQTERDTAQQALNASREQATAIASASEAWVQQQTSLTHQIETLLQTLEPQRTEQAQLRERSNQLSQQIAEQTQLIARLEPELAENIAKNTEQSAEFNTCAEPIENLAQTLVAAEKDLQIQQETQKRLLQEQREKQRELDKIEAQAQAQQEATGTLATKVIIQSGLTGICGLVAQLGRVEPRYQLALETAAGARLGQIVVEDDAVAAAAIALLKEKRAGRATFLPLNKIQAPRFTETQVLRYAHGFIDYAINLIECDQYYRKVFAYVFGGTVVFESLENARNYLGQHRIVTLEGELLETSGAMTGGISNQRSTLRFGTTSESEGENLQAKYLQNRLGEIERILELCGETITNLSGKIKRLTGEVTEARSSRREKQLRLEGLNKEIKTLTSQLEASKAQLTQNTTRLTEVQSRLEILDRELPALEAELQQLRQALAELESSQTPQEWQEIQAVIKIQEQELQQQEQSVRETEQRLKSLESQQQRLHEKNQEGEERIEEYRKELSVGKEAISRVSTEMTTLNQQIEQTKASLRELEKNLGEEKLKRDRTEQELRQRQLNQQQLEWELSKLQETQTTRREELATIQTQLQTQAAELPEILPEVPPQINLEDLQKDVRSLVKRMQAMEPVNMLALEEYERTQKRLDELTQKLQTLEAERTELLLRIENFTTLRQRAFKEAFDAVNENFQSIFATLSDGDGYLQLDNPEDPFNSGLNLVAHPKGKPVQRLASMSGGEKSLTALSFIFALQRYRPSPFYAFDEVDMFLDGANVERLARMIKQQAQQAQFIVVSLRRPMIESAERTIGVTQARGAYTQVLGIKI
ncbi:MAG: chromosome segregation protein SMC [Nostocaceae cyanobacterium]|nr:chromosome segregation protein SMC [Nostocaceae cyanobacterium]